MYKCEVCKKSTKHGTPEIKIVTEKRNVRYENGSTGWEIVKEKKVCPNCAEKAEK